MKKQNKTNDFCLLNEKDILESDKKGKDNKEEKDKEKISNSKCVSCFSCDCFVREDDFSTKTPLELIQKKEKFFSGKKNLKALKLFNHLRNILEIQEKKNIAIISMLNQRSSELNEIIKRNEKNKEIENTHFKISLFKNIVDCFDSLLLIEKNSQIDKDIENIKKGLNITVSLFKNKIIKNYNIEIIDPKIGEEFIPNLHESFSTEKNDKYPENTILSVLTNGYKINNTLIKPCLVKVNKKENS